MLGSSESQPCNVNRQTSSRTTRPNSTKCTRRLNDCLELKLAQRFVSCRKYYGRRIRTHNARGKKFYAIHSQWRLYWLGSHTYAAVWALSCQVRIVDSRFRSTGYESDVLLSQTMCDRQNIEKMNLH